MELYNDIKSDNLQFNSLGRWVVRLIVQVSDGPSIILIDWKKQWIAGLDLENSLFLQRILMEIMEKKNNTWNIIRLDDEMIVPSTQQPSVSYWRLSDL